MALLDGLTVVYLEDDADTREVMTIGLERHGARVLASESVQHAFLIYEAERPDVIVSDIRLPEMDGWTFMQAVRDMPGEREKRTPAIAVTVHNTPADRLRSLWAGFTLHIAKPLSPDQLASRIALIVQPVPSA